MSRKIKPAPKKPSKAYLVSFGDTMTALLAFFIVLNSLAIEQTGMQLHAGTGSFVRAMKKTGFPGSIFSQNSDRLIALPIASPIYAIPENEKKREKNTANGPDDEGNAKMVRDRQSDNFQRFLNEMDYQFSIVEQSPIASQVVFDSFEQLRREGDSVLGPNALQIVADGINQLSSHPSYEVEIIVWANLPSEQGLNRAMSQAMALEKFLDASFRFTGDQRSRLQVTAKNWLFSDAKRPKISLVMSRRAN